MLYYIVKVAHIVPKLYLSLLVNSISTIIFLIGGLSWVVIDQLRVCWFLFALWLYFSLKNEVHKSNIRWVCTHFFLSFPSCVLETFSRVQSTPKEKPPGSLRRTFSDKCEKTQLQNKGGPSLFFKPIRYSSYPFSSTHAYQRWASLRSVISLFEFGSQYNNSTLRQI
jgi:hypothetical protein